MATADPAHFLKDPDSSKNSDGTRRINAVIPRNGNPTATGLIYPISMTNCIVDKRRLQPERAEMLTTNVPRAAGIRFP